LVTDDLHPQDLLERGHLDHVLRKAVRLGLDPLTALQMVTLNPAEFFRLRGRGAVAPGYCADLVVLGNLENFVVDRVYKDGRPVSMQGGSLCSWEKQEGFSFPADQDPSSQHRASKIRKPRARVIELIQADPYQECVEEVLL
jgi:adenine deaminase